jgi:hypothetical protein
VRDRCGAGGDAHYAERFDEFVELWLPMLDRSIKTTGSSMKLAKLLVQNCCYLMENRASHSDFRLFPAQFATVAQAALLRSACPDHVFKTGTLDDSPTGTWCSIVADAGSILLSAIDNADRRMSGCRLSMKAQSLTQ